MRVCFLVPALGRSGGAATIRTLVAALNDLDGHEADVVVTDPRAPEGRTDPMPDTEYDVAIATWWETAADLWSVRARRRAVLLQSLESRFYEERHFVDRLAAEEVLALPVAFMPVARWMADLLRELRPEAQVVWVPAGVDKAAFAPRERPPRTGPLRVLIDGQPSMWFKGVDDALAATAAMREPAEVTVVAGDPATAGDVPGARVVGGLDARGMADLYGAHDVLVKLSRVEGFGLAPVEAACVGTPCVVTPYTGHEEHVVHGRNGLVARFDDVRGTARALDRLATDAELLDRLSQGALASAGDAASTDAMAASFVDALRQIADGPEPDAGTALAHAHRRRTELAREHLRVLTDRADRAEGERDWYRRGLDEARAHVEELNAAMRELERIVDEKDQLIADIRAERAYRAAAAVRRLLPGRER